MVCAMRRADVKTTQDHFETLWDIVDKSRSTSKNVTVDKAAIVALLMDHASLHEAAFSVAIIKPRKFTS